jgi:hypothetical protein
MEQAEQFKTSVGTLLASMVDQLSTARETADQAARLLAGEQIAQPMGMGGGMDGGMGGGMDGGMGGGMDGGMPSGAEMGSDLDTDEFAATDAAVGGAEALGREKR